VRNYPGIDAAGLIFPVVPGDGPGGDNGFEIAGRPPLPVGQMRYANHRWSDPGYFAAIGIPILRGHSFDENMQVHPHQVIISDSFARQYFSGEDPIGQHLLTMGRKPYEIVGVVGDTRTSASDLPQPMMYFPIYMADWVYASDYINGASLVIRSREDVAQFSAPVQSIFQQLDPDIPVSDVLTMDQIIGRNNVSASFDAILLLVFAIVSLVLAAVGLFGVLSYIVTQRTTEIGIRIALGARREQVMRLMIGDGLRPAAIGLALGLIASAGLTQLIASMLYGTTALDPAVFAVVSATLVVVASIACAVPAWRASHLDPITALRME
jgi:predicted permease